MTEIRDTVGPGTFFGVGVGPGDPELITIKAQRVLRQAPVVCLPKSREEGASYVRTFVSHLIDPSRQQLIELVFPMTKDRSVLEQHWEAALEQVLTPLRAGARRCLRHRGRPLHLQHLHAPVRSGRLRAIRRYRSR